MDLDRRQEDAAKTLGAGGWTIFLRVTLPAVVLPWIGASLLSFARAVGEFGSVVIVAGNIPLRSQTAAVYVLGAVESENRLGASAVSIVLVAAAFVLMLVTNRLYRRWREAV
jgi:sulfate transport system permease protein